MTTITLPRAVVEQALEAIRCGVPTGRITLEDWRKAEHDLRAALAEPQSGWDKWQAQKRGCSVCGIGANGETVGYVCPRFDCPTKITCGGAV